MKTKLLISLGVFIGILALGFFIPLLFFGNKEITVGYAGDEPSRTITTTNYTYCRTLTTNNNGYAGGIATTTSLLFPLIATSTISDLAATSSAGHVSVLDSTNNTPLDVVFVDEATCWLGGTTAIPHYFEKYASTTGAFTVHLGTSDISSTSAKTLAMYYGTSTAIDLNSPGQTYATSTLGQVGVWDLSVPGSATTTYPDFTDSTYNANHGSSKNMNNADLVDGQVDGALSFDGVDDYVNLNSSNLPYGANTRSFAFWVKPTVLQTKNVLGYGTEAGTQLFDIILVNNGIVGIHWYGNTVTDEFPNTIYTAGVWQHIVFTYDGTLIRSYVNGALKDTYVKALNTVDGGTFTIAKGVYSYYYMNGLIDEVRIYNRALGAMDILTIYNNGKNSTNFWTIGSEQTQGAPPAAAPPPGAIIWWE